MERKYKLSRVGFSALLIFNLGVSTALYSFDRSVEPKEAYADLSAAEAINKKINDIILDLDLHETSDVHEQLLMACRLQKYIVLSNIFDEKIVEEKSLDNNQNMYTRDLYRAVIENRGVCTSNSAEFKEILSRVGIDTLCVFVQSKEDVHMCNLVKIGGKYYYFDSTLEKSAYDTYKDDFDEFVLCAAGLGRATYEKYYKPIGIMNSNFDDKLLTIPDNIALEDIPIEIINQGIKEDTKKVL